jgi:hypothetical protein
MKGVDDIIIIGEEPLCVYACIGMDDACLALIQCISKLIDTILTNTKNADSTYHLIHANTNQYIQYMQYM